MSLEKPTRKSRTSTVRAGQSLVIQRSQVSRANPAPSTAFSLFLLSSDAASRLAAIEKRSSLYERER